MAPNLGLGLGIHKLYNPALFGTFDPLVDIVGLGLYLNKNTNVNTKVAADFVAANNEYLSSASTDFDKGDESFSFGCWVNMDLQPANSMIGGTDGAVGNYSYCLYYTAGSGFKGFISADGTAYTILSSTLTIPLNTWGFVVMVYDAVNDLIKISLDGSDFQTTSHSGGGFATHDGVFTLGDGSVTSVRLDGSIDAPFFYDKALTLAEVKALYNTDSGVDYPSLTDLNSTTYAIGQSFTAASSQYLSSASTDFDKGNEDFSFCCWVYMDSYGTNSNLLGKWNATGNQRSYLMQFASGTDLRFNTSPDGTSTGNGQVACDTTTWIGNWNFLVVVHDSVNDIIKTSVNGNDFTTSSYSGGCFAGSTADLIIGGQSGAVNYFDGKIDALNFYDKVLSLAEVNALYNSGNGVDYPSLTDLNGTEYAIGKRFSSGNYYTEPYDTVWNIAYVDFAYGGWFESTDVTTTQTVFAKWGASGTYQFRVYIAASILYVGYSSNGTAFGAKNMGAISNNTPYFLAVSHDNDTSTWSISLNGAAFQTVVYNISSNKVADLALGASSIGAAPLLGKMQNWFAGRTQIDITDVAELYNSGSGINYEDVSAALQSKFLAWWALDEAEGVTASDKYGNHDAPPTGTPVSTIGFTDNQTITTIESSLVSWWDLNDVEGADQTDSVTLSANDLTPVNTPVSTTGKITDTTIATIESSLVDWWRLNETSGDRLGELGHTLTDNATVGYALGKVQEVSVNATNVADFVAASSEHLSTADTSFGFTTESFTLSGWFKWDILGTTSTLFNKWNGTGSQKAYSCRKDSSNNLTFIVSTDGSTNSTTLTTSYTVTSGTWYYITWVRDATNDLLKISLNGGSFETIAFTGDIYASNDDLILGFTYAANYFDGQMDSLNVYSKALTFAEVQALYNTSHLQYSELPDLVGNTYAVGQVLDGSTDAFNIDGVLTDLATTTTGEIEMYICPTDATPTGTERMFSFGDTDADTYIVFDITTTGLFRIMVNKAGVNQWRVQTDVAAFTSGVWTKIGVVQDGVSPVLYVDDVAVATTFTSTFDTTVWLSDLQIDNVRIGCFNFNSSGDAYFFNGTIQNVKIWSDDTQTTLVANYAMNNVEGALQLNSEEASVDNAMVLGGTADALNIDSVLTPLASTTTGYIECYYTPTNTGGAAEEIITFGDTSAKEDFQFASQNATGILTVFFRIAGVIQFQVSTDVTPFTNGVSTKIAVKQDGVLPIIYVDDVAVAQTTITSTDTTAWFNDASGLDNGRIGCRKYDGGVDEFFMNGKIQDIKIWSDDTQTTLVANYECDVLGLDSENGYNATAIGNPTLHSLNTNATPIGTPVSGLASVVSDTITDMTTDMVAYWNLDETSGDRYDYHNPTVDNAILLDGSTDALNIDSALTPLASTTTGYWEMYYTPVDATPTTSEALFCFGDTDADEIINTYILSTGKFSVFCKKAGVTQFDISTDNVVFSDGISCKISVKFDGILPVLYINDVAVAQTTTVSTDTTTFLNDLTGLDNGRLGCRNKNSLGNDLFAEGTIQNVKIWSDDTQTTLVAHYKMDETDGSRFDSSGNDYTATEIGTPDYVSLTTMLKDNNTVGSATFNRLGLVHNWIDQSTNAYVFSQDTIADMPLLQENSIEFDGTDDILDYTVADVYGGDSSGIIFFSGYYDNTTFNVILATGDTATTNYYLWLGVLGSGELFVSCKDGTTTDTVKSTNTIVNGAYYYGYIKSTGTAYEINLNGTDEVLITTAGTNRGHFFADILNRDNITIGSMLRSSGNYGSTQPNKIIYSNDHTINTAPILKFMSNPDN